MKNILHKKIKIVISFLLIIAVCSPIYATISSADGTSFITKAEFDSTVNDFQSRLTTFEAGINSKIDSQVTSYLDRNGIWSAVEQKLEKTFVSYTMQSIMPLTIFTDTQGTGAEKALPKVLIISKLTKSGLLFMNAYHGIAASSNDRLTNYGETTLARGFMHMTSTASGYYTGSPDYKVYYAWSQYNPNFPDQKITESPRQIWVDKNVTEFGSYTSYSSVAYCQIHLFPLRGFSILNLFVSKGNQLYLTPTATWSAGSNISQFTKITGNFTENDVTGSIGLVISSANIY